MRDVLPVDKKCSRARLSVFQCILQLFRGFVNLTTCGHRLHRFFRPHRQHETGRVGGAVSSDVLLFGGGRLTRSRESARAAKNEGSESYVREKVVALISLRVFRAFAASRESSASEIERIG